MTSRKYLIFTFTFFSMLASILFLTGCNASRELSVVDISKDNDRSITLKVRDGRVITFEGDKYFFISRDSVWSMVGKGKLQPSNESFDGQIPVDQIESITTSYYTPFFYVSIFAASLSLAFVVWVLSTWHCCG